MAVESAASCTSLPKVSSSSVVATVQLVGEAVVDTIPPRNPPVVITAKLPPPLDQHLRRVPRQQGPPPPGHPRRNHRPNRRSVMNLKLMKVIFRFSPVSRATSPSQI
jgi:hypothetical protein